MTTEGEGSIKGANMKPKNGPQRAKKKLSINPLIIAKAEKLAKKRFQSLSGLAEDVIARELRASGIDPWSDDYEEPSQARAERKPDNPEG